MGTLHGTSVLVMPLSDNLPMATCYPGSGSNQNGRVLGFFDPGSFCLVF